MQEVYSTNSVEQLNNVQLKHLDVVERTTKLTLVICVSFAVAWFPFSLYILIYSIHGGNAVWISIFSLPAYVYGVSDIFIYMARSREFRHAVRTVLCGGVQNAVDTTVHSS